MNQEIKQTFTIVHMNSSHKTLRMAVSCVDAIDLNSAKQLLAVDSNNHNETIQYLCAFLGKHENLLDGTSDVQPSTRPSDTIEPATDLPKHPFKSK